MEDNKMTAHSDCDTMCNELLNITQEIFIKTPGITEIEICHDKTMILNAIDRIHNLHKIYDLIEKTQGKSARLENQRTITGTFLWPLNERLVKLEKIEEFQNMKNIGFEDSEI